MNEPFVFQGFAKPSYTQVPDEFFDELMPCLKEAELRVLLYIIRRTFGFKKDSEAISLTQMVDGIKTRSGKVLDHGTGMSRRGVMKGCAGLLEKGIITVEKRKSDEGDYEINIYRLRFKDEGVGNVVPYGGEPSALGVGNQVPLQQTVIQQTDLNHSSIREESSQKNEETDDPASPQTRPEQGSQPVTPSPTAAQPPGLNRSYLRQARAKDQPKTHDLTSLASILPQPPQQRQRSYTEERQVLVDVIADLAREFRDEATLTESVSRAYNLMQQAKITDIGVFVSRIYEARSITKERYGSIKRRMPYFFSVLQDICGLKQKTTIQNPPSG